MNTITFRLSQYIHIVRFSTFPIPMVKHYVQILMWSGGNIWCVSSNNDKTYHLSVTSDYTWLKFCLVWDPLTNGVHLSLVVMKIEGQDQPPVADTLFLKTRTHLHTHRLQHPNIPGSKIKQMEKFSNWCLKTKKAYMWAYRAG